MHCTIPPIAIPEGIETDVLQEVFVIPAIEESSDPLPDEFEVPRPHALKAATEDDRVRIQKLGERRWILAEASPSEIWPQINQFLQLNGIQVVYKNAPAGIMETQWLFREEERASKDKYRFLVEEGLHRETAEIHVLQITVPASLPGSGKVNWPERSVRPEREAILLEELANYLAADVDRASVSLLAQSIGGGSKASLFLKGESPYLQLRLDFSRAWATTGKSLELAGYDIVKAERANGDYFVVGRHVDVQEGWFDFIFGPDEVVTTEQFRVHLEQRATYIWVTIEPYGKQRPSRERLEQLLITIRENLI